MPTFRPDNPLHYCLRKQRGAALMVMLVILIVGASAILLSSLNSATLLSERNKITSNALAQAKDGLIGRAVSDANHPGSLPCPDTNDDGTGESTVGQPGNNCPGYIGRLPWKTLGLPDLRDESGERLWYALSPSFRDSASNFINSNTNGTLQVYDNSGTVLLTPTSSEAVAIIIAPGAIVASQQRDTVNQSLAQNYLDIGPNNVNNSASGGPFIAANKTNSFNDRLIIITTRDIISVVEKRVAKDLATAFASYLTNNGNKYPYPANFNSCTSTSACPSDNTVCLGKIPLTAITTYLPNTWIANNNWFDIVYYTAGTNFMSGGMGMGMGCATTLNVSGVSASALFIMPGISLNGISRSISLNLINMADYFEDSENQNLDATYVTPSTSSNDTLKILP